jgi:hypothetical protein
MTLADRISCDRRGRGSLLAEERYWDAIVLGDPLPLDNVDPQLAATIQLVHAIDDTPLPDSAFATRLERDLLWSAPHARPGSSAPDPRASRARLDIAGVPARWPYVTRRRMVTPLAATAALLAIMLASVVVSLLIASLAVRERGELPIVLGPGITGEMLLQARFDTLPDGILGADIERWVVQPGAELPMGREETSGEGPSAYLVEAGTLTVQTDGPLAVTRAGTIAPVTMEAVSQTELQTGDRGFVPLGVTSLWRNDGDTPVRVLEAKVRIGATYLGHSGVLNYSVISEWPFTRPDHPIVMTVFQMTLEPDIDLAADAIPGLLMLKVEAGRLVAVDVDDDGNLLPSVELGQATRYLGSFPPGRVFRGGNDEPVSVLLVTIAGRNPLTASG